MAVIFNRGYTACRRCGKTFLIDGGHSCASNARSGKRGRLPLLHSRLVRIGERLITVEEWLDMVDVAQERRP